MGVFSALRATRAFRRRHLGFLETREDCDVVLEIGFHQEHGAPLTMKRLQLLGLASIPTLQRRLRRLRQVGAIVARKSQIDGRAVELVLSPKLMRTYAKYGELIMTLEMNGAPSAAVEETAEQP